MTVIHHRRCLALKMKYNYIFFRLIVRACLLIILLGGKMKRNLTGFHCSSSGGAFCSVESDVRTLFHDIFSKKSLCMEITALIVRSFADGTWL